MPENKGMREKFELLKTFWNNGRMKLDHHVFLERTGSFLQGFFPSDSNLSKNTSFTNYGELTAL